MDLSLTAPTPAEFKGLYDQTGWPERPLERFESALAGSWLVCTAHDADGALTGVGRLISDGTFHAFVAEVIVDEAQQGQGIGQRILSRLVDEAHARGVDDVQLFASRGQSAFFEQNGFEARRADTMAIDLADLD